MISIKIIVYSQLSSFYYELIEIFLNLNVVTGSLVCSMRLVVRTLPNTADLYFVLTYTDNIFFQIVSLKVNS